MISILWIGLVFSGCAGLKPKHSVETTEIQTTEKMPPRRALDHYIRALGYEDNRYYDGAIAEYRRALYFDPLSVELHMGAARNYYIIESLDSASVEIRRVLDIEPGNEEALAMLGNVLVGSNQWESAESVFKDLTQKNPESTTYCAHLAAIYLAVQKPDSALSEYLRLYDLDGGNLQILDRAAGMMTMNNYFDQALTLYRKILPFQPDNDRIIYSIGSVFLQLNNADSAVVYLENAYEKNPANVQYRLALAFMYNRRGRYTEAENLLRGGLEIAPNDNRLMNVLGSVLQAQQRYDEALEILYKSIEIDSMNIQPYITIGFIYDEQHELEKAVNIYNRALKIDSTAALVLNNYAYLLAEAGLRLDEALKYSAKALELEPENPSYLDTMGWLLFKTGEYENGEVYMRKALEYDQNSIMYLHLGDILEKRGSLKEAEEIYRKGLELEPDNIELKQRLEIQ